MHNSNTLILEDSRNYSNILLEEAFKEETMGLINSVKNFVFQKGYDDDDYLYEDEYEMEEDDRYPRLRNDDAVTYIDSRRSTSRDSSAAYRAPEYRAPEYRRSEKTSDTVSLTSRTPAPKQSEQDRIYTIPSATDVDIIVSDPLVFEDGLAICDLLKQRKPVIVNMENVDVKEAQRIMDFLAGVVYCVNGDIQEITSRIFIVAPENVNVSDHTKEHLKAQGIFSPFKSVFGGR